MKLCGKNPVLERIKTDPGSIRRLYLQKAVELSSIVKAAKEKGIKFDSVDKSQIEGLCPGLHTQGVVAEIPDPAYAVFEELVSECLKGTKALVFADGITDPHNLGAMIRSMACLGGFSLVIPEHGAVLLNETVVRIASGGENYVTVSMVPNIATAVRKARGQGVKVYGAVADGGTDVRKMKWEKPLGVVIGSEGKGIRPGILKQLDERVSLPMEGARLSYNASVAAALLFYEIFRISLKAE